MPLYDYECAAGHRFEVFRSLSELDEPLRCECGEKAERQVSAPMVKSDCIDPIRGADGKMHTSLASYRASLLPSGNPKGERYIELGDQELKPQTYDYCPKKRREDLKAAVADVKNGRVSASA